jgi:hypothetical protein
MIPAFSTRNSTAPPLAALHGLADVHRHRSDARVRHQAAWSENLPKRPTSAIMSGVAMQRSKLIVPPWTSWTSSSAPTTSAPAAFASSAFRTARKHSNASRPPRTVRQVAHAANDLVGVLRVDTQVHCDFDRLVELRLGARDLMSKLLRSDTTRSGRCRLWRPAFACHQPYGLAWRSGDTFAISLTLHLGYPSNAPSQQSCARPARRRRC